MVLRKLSNGRISGTGTIQCKSFILGGVLISTNNTNAAAVQIRRDDVNGKLLFDISTITSMFATAPISTEGTQTLYYSITGTGGSAQLYEWVD